MDRRDFVGRCAAVAAGLAGGEGLGPLASAGGAASRPSDAPQRPTGKGPLGGARRLTRIGLELYSVRDAMRRDPERTLAAVAAMGYTDVELLWSFGNFGRTPQQVRDALASAGLRARSAHVTSSAILVGWERSLDLARFLGQEYIICPGFTVDTQRSLDDWKEWADHFNRAGELARKAGIWVALHNEPDHQRPLQGRIPFEVFAERIDPRYVRLQLDVGNMAMGGGDPFAFLAKYGDRCWSFHLKDVVPDRSRDTELGRGTMDFKRLLASIGDVDQKAFFVEQEGSKDSLGSAKENFDYLSRLEF
ncbi:MAG TPA: sugar phosphate isomerase/epimerase [Gemmatimonadaceae bacterium]|nr:sugar phosphate isomerase/epimerase [Gemmatimonadaceae bacterium]